MITLLFFFQVLWSISCAITLNIPPSITDQPSSKSIVYFDKNEDDGSGDVSNQLMLNCRATGTLPLNYQWKKNDMIININDQSLYKTGTEGNLIFVRPVRNATTGFYQCFATNTFGTALSNKVEVRLYTYPQSSTNAVAYSSNQGSSFQLPCTSLKTDPKPVYKWQTVSNFQDTNAKDIVLDEHMRITENGTLYFSYLLSTDNQLGRLYRCQIQNPDVNSQIAFVGYANLSIGPLINQPLQMNLLFKSVYPLVPLVSQKVTLYCFFSGATDIIIAWATPSGSSPSGTRYEILGNTLTILSVIKADSGEYKCTGTSRYSSVPSSSAIIPLDVKELPNYQQIQDRPYDKTSSKGSTIIFNCSAKADPIATNKWYRNGEPLDLNNLRSNLELNANQSQLMVKNLCKDNCGNLGSDLAVYQCLSSNAYGSVFSNGYIGVLDPTVITFISNNILYDPKVVPEFRCEAKTDEATMPILTYNWLFNGQIVNNGNFNTTNTSVLRIPTSESGRYVGDWTCNATDTFSFASSTVQLYKAAGANVWPYWWIPLIVILALLIFILLICCICCCLYQNRGDDYPVDDIEYKIGNDPVKELENSGFHDYQRQGLLPRTGSVDGGTLTGASALKIKRNPGSLSGSLGKLNSDEDSLANYSNINPTKFNEDGSFIDRYNTGPRQTYA